MIYGFMNYNRLFIALVATLSVLTINGQMLGTDNSQFSIFNFQLMDSIESNNTTLIALRTEAEARKLDNRTGIALPDPKVGLKRMWEGAEEAGKLAEFTVGQSFDLSIVLGYRSRAAASQNLLVDEEYRLARMEILLEAQLVCIDLAYYNALVNELDRRLGHARRVVEAEQHRLESGDTDALSYNNVLLSLSALEAEREQACTEQALLTAQLTRLNGGVPLGAIGSLDVQEGQVPLANLDSLVAQALEHSPAMALVRAGHDVAQSDLSLAKAQHLPTLSATYINERHTIGDRSQGVAVGVSLPLWANKNRVRTARAALQAAQAREADTQLQLRSQLRADYERVQGLQRTATIYRTALTEADNTAILGAVKNKKGIAVFKVRQCLLVCVKVCTLYYLQSVI
jgi:outer membrane protein TolC